MANAFSCRSSCASATNFIVCALILASLTLLFLQPTTAAPNCQEIVGEVSDEACLQGVVHDDFCNRDVCGKGPGEQCGGRYNEYGLCGVGMFCNACGRCCGCNRLLKCHPDFTC